MKALDLTQKNSAGQTLTRERWVAARFRSPEFKVGVEGDFRTGLTDSRQPCSPSFPYTFYIEVSGPENKGRTHYPCA